MKRLFCVLLLALVLVVVGCLANPAILADKNAEPFVESGLMMIDLNTLFEALQPYLGVWGPYTELNTHICADCEGIALFGWIDANGQVIHYVQFQSFNGEWIIIQASEILGIAPASTS